MIDKQIMRRHFSRNAGTYDEYANVQKKMAVELINMVKDQNPSEILDIGCGTGLLTQMLCETFPKARITAIDIAPGMIELSQRKLSAPNVTFRCADIEEIVIFPKYDLIISNASFQWFNSMGPTISRLYQALSERGILCFSTFGEKTFHELRQSYAKARNKTGIKTLSMPGQSFYSLQETFSLCWDYLADDYPGQIKAKESLVYEYFPSVKAFFESLKKIGANNSNREHRVTNPSLLKNMIQIYEDEFTKNNQVTVTYHCLFVSIGHTAKGV